MIRHFCAALLCLVMAGAHAHAKLETAVPSQDAKLDAAPKEISLKFTAPLEAPFSNIALEDSAKKSVALPKASVDGQAMRVALPALPAGEYTVQWSAMTRDGHKVKGEYHFTVR